MNSKFCSRNKHSNSITLVNKIENDIHNNLLEKRYKEIMNLIFKKWCPGADSNHRHEDFQSSALPTELPGRYHNLYIYQVKLSTIEKN